jgi:hypothetical protein
MRPARRTTRDDLTGLSRSERPDTRRPDTRPELELRRIGGRCVPSSRPTRGGHQRGTAFHPKLACRRETRAPPAPASFRFGVAAAPLPSDAAAIRALLATATVRACQPDRSIKGKRSARHEPPFCQFHVVAAPPPEARRPARGTLAFAGDERADRTGVKETNRPSRAFNPS